MFTTVIVFPLLLLRRLSISLGEASQIDDAPGNQLYYFLENIFENYVLSYFEFYVTVKNSS